MRSRVNRVLGVWVMEAMKETMARGFAPCLLLVGLRPGRAGRLIRLGNSEKRRSVGRRPTNSKHGAESCAIIGRRLKICFSEILPYLAAANTRYHAPDALLLWLLLLLRRRVERAAVCS